MAWAGQDYSKMALDGEASADKMASLMWAKSLQCFRCSTKHPFDAAAYMCIACAADTANPDPGILDVLYDYAAAGNAIRAAMKDVRTGSGESGRGVFKWLPLLPLEKPPSNTLQAGDTPLISAPRLAARLGLATLYIKDETRNPTRCLKDRATAVGMAMAMAQGRKEVFCASAGNAAISLAGFAAHAGIPCHVFVPSYASATRLDWLRRYGADVHVSKGNYDDAFAESETKGRAHGWWSRNCALNPFLVEGKKTCALEIGEQLKWIPPDFVVAPVGDGCTLGAIGKGFRELQLLELTKGLPRLIGIQAEAVQPLVRRHSGAAARDDSGSTQASSIAVRRPRNALRLLRELKESSGTMLAVSDAETAEAQTLLAREAGVVAEFTSATTLAGLQKLATRESMRGKTAVIVITGGRLD